MSCTPQTSLPQEVQETKRLTLGPGQWEHQGPAWGTATLGFQLDPGSLQSLKLGSGSRMGGRTGLGV